MWKNAVQPDRPKLTIWYGACALYAVNLRLQTHSEYVILTAFPLQQWLHDRASTLCYSTPPVLCSVCEEQRAVSRQQHTLACYSTQPVLCSVC